ncbi:hypothetical protein CWC46_01495 [Prodigiosinella confusarubida]|uniref:Uncharacterized protein n=1 Tax=Serratia sp. (strain ATCC 39006) TaxID=104623 RepID=A0A2I5TEE8_SERS3|nr:hypothetical protein [Serratia sp. ATCC 39006]AUG98611.1 hypothetical protein CWC46_01495 [Serratia sp. ATCC 39006]AUH02926.1 hypothetical protein Ser39006_001495 [Serratia sp. ATCC 39006]
MRLLFICPNWADLATPIVKEMQRQGHDVIHIDHRDLSTFTYFDSRHWFIAKIYKIITGKNYKRLSLDNQITLGLHNFFIGREPFDTIIMTEPKLFNEQHFTILQQYSQKLVAVLWDSLKKAPNNALYLSQFDHVLSYDHVDCNQYHFTKINNYIDPDWKSNMLYQDCEYDVFSIMSFTEARYKQAIYFLDQNPELTSNIIFYADNDKKRKQIKDTRLKIANKPLLGNELAREIDNSRSILDLLQGQQAGLSFRVYESMAYQRKLITSNTHTVDYDFYNDNNIHILNQSWHINPDFIHSPYKPIPEEIYNQYTLSTWVQKVIQEISSDTGSIPA